MTSDALIQTHIDAAVKERAEAVLTPLGLSLSDAVRIMLTRTAEDGVLPFDPGADTDEHDRWFRSTVQDALDGLESGTNRVIPDSEWKEISKRKREELASLISSQRL